MLGKLYKLYFCHVHEMVHLISAAFEVLRTESVNRYDANARFIAYFEDLSTSAIVSKAVLECERRLYIQDQNLRHILLPGLRSQDYVPQLSLFGAFSHIADFHPSQKQYAVEQGLAARNR